MRILKYFTDNYDSIVFFDVETTGLSYANDDVIEFACIHINKKGTARCYDRLINIGRSLPPYIVELTNITDEMLVSEGVERDKVAELIEKKIFGNGRVLLVAHNVNFDANFIAAMFKRSGRKIDWSRIDLIDTLTILRDRKSFPHKLENAITHYGLDGMVKNSHRAIDDVKALLMVFEKMSDESNDVKKYINIYGYNPKYGIRESEKIPKLRYVPQSYHMDKKAYDAE